MTHGKDGDTLRIGGALAGKATGLYRLVMDHCPGQSERLELDLGDVESLDGACVAALVRAWREARAREGNLAIVRASKAVQRSLELFDALGGDRGQPSSERAVLGLLEGLGEATISRSRGLVSFLQLAADSTAATLTGIIRPSTIRWGAVIEQTFLIGYKALPIVGLVAFLIGLTLAFQSAYQLRQFGAAIFVANLTGVAMVREMGPLMTAILVAGRSGSSIAAEISTMEISEEIDALQVMGISPIGYLAVPRLLAIMLALPLLTVMADLLGILGGFTVGVAYLDLPPVLFINQTLESLVPRDLLTGLAKSFAFAWGIGLVGLHYGFSARGGAEEVGKVTTASVVASIFYIIVADCLFSVLFYIVL